MTLSETDVRRSNGAGTGQTDETAGESEYLPTGDGTRYRRYILVKLYINAIYVIHNHFLSTKSSATVPMYRIPC